MQNTYVTYLHKHLEIKFMKSTTSEFSGTIDAVRELYDHKVTELNRRNIRVYAADEPNPVHGANHHYIINAVEEAQTSDGWDRSISEVEIEFQNGALQETGCNGITDQALLAVVLDRLRGFQSGQFSCRENSIAITKLEEALLWMGKRANDRAMRGVEGTHQK